MDLDDVDIRVLGCLVEKQRTTPDQYPLTLNALRLACNQTTNRDPVVSYDEATVRDSVQGLGRRRLARLASGPGSRAPKYRHLLDEALGLDDAELSLLAVLMLRGPQTPGELKARAERLHRFAGLGAVEATLERLIERELAERLERRPGQKEVRYRQLLGGAGAAPAAQPATSATQPATPAAQPATSAAQPASLRSAVPLEQRVQRLEAEVEALRSALDELRADRRP